MIYFPLVPQILIGDLVPQFYMRVEESKRESQGEEKKRDFVFGFAVKDKKDVEEKNIALRQRSVLIDIASVVKGAENPFSISSEDGENFVAQATSEHGSTSVIFVSPNREAGAFARLELFHKESGNPFVVLNRIELNQPVPDECFIFPKDDLMESGLPVTNSLL